MADAIAPSSSPPPGSSAHKERHSLTLDQRRALRRWANSRIVRPSHKDCITWFEAQYGQVISQSTVSHSLSPKYARLDDDPTRTGSRLRDGNWPEVENLVLLWFRQVVSGGRHPSNEELADKAKAIFQQLPKYKEKPQPEFSPGWIHRFKKRYNLLIRRQRRGGSADGSSVGVAGADAALPAAATADDVQYLVEAVPRFMAVGADTNPAAIRDIVQRVVGVEPSLDTCARVRDEIVRRLSPHGHGGHPLAYNGDAAADHEHTESLAAAAQALQAVTQTPTQAAHHHHPHHHPHHPSKGDPASQQVYADDDPEVVLQNALRALQQEEAEAEAAVAGRDDRDLADRNSGAGATGGGNKSNNNSNIHPSLGQAYAQQAAVAADALTEAKGTPAQHPSNSAGGAHRYSSSSGPAPRSHDAHGAGDLALTTMPERPVRCPFCVNTRMLRSIQEAVDHMQMHVVV